MAADSCRSAAEAITRPVCGHTSTPSVTRVTSQYSLIGLCDRQETLFNGIASLLYPGGLGSPLVHRTVRTVASVTWSPRTSRCTQL